MKPLIRLSGRVLGTIRAEWRQLDNRYFGSIEHFSGDAEQICRQIVERLWEGDFYRTSLGHFDFFWMRDFGTVCESLVIDGQTQRVHHTLKWVMHKYRRANIVTLCIDKLGNTFDAPSKSIDALPWLLHCLHVSNYKLTHPEKEFLNAQLLRHRNLFLDKNGMVKSMKFAEMRDAVMYDRSAYAVALVGRMAYCADELGLDNPFHVKQYRDDLMNHYWNGKFFKADRRTNAFSAECALFPFFLRIINDEKLADKTFDYINHEKLNVPYPLIYTKHEDKFNYHFWMTSPFMPNYEAKTIWSWHGAFYLHVLKRYKRPEYRAQKAKFAEMIEMHGTFPEMMNLDGTWYYAPIYRGDPGMVWAGLYLDL